MNKSAWPQAPCPLGSGSSAAFPLTPWSAIGRSAADDDTVALEALSHLLRLYQIPVTCHLVLKFRVTEDQALEWFQGFVEKRVLKERLLARAQPERGRFRSFVLTALDSYVVDQLRHARAAKRQPHAGVVSIEILSPQESETIAAETDRSVEQKWAQTILERALVLMEEECTAKGARVRWETFRLCYLRPELEGVPRIPYAELIRRLPIRSPAEAANFLATAKRMLQRLVRKVIAEYARDEAEVAEEMCLLGARSSVRDRNEKRTCKSPTQSRGG
jgi:RNA polymerase sigma-70 factor (ECF subfamily)